MDLKEKIGCLKQLRHLGREADQLSRRIDGMDEAAPARKRLEARRERCLVQLRALYGFIDGIDDSQMRQIMARRYVDGCTWRGVAAYIGERDEQYPRRLHNRFLQGAVLPEALTKKAEEREG